MKIEPLAALMTREPWRASLSLKFEQRQPRTALTRNMHEGPIRVQKALYPEGDAVCQTLLVHPPGGIAGGDEVALDVHVGDGAHAQITTPGAGKWYRSFGVPARWSQRLTMQGTGVLEWLPQESIVFNQANSYSTSYISVSEHNTLAIWDILCLGCPASGESFDLGSYRSDWCLRVAGKPIWRERAGFEGGSALLQSPVGLRGRPVLATLLLSTQALRQAPDAEATQAALRTLRAIEPREFDAGMLAGATALPCGIIVRALAYEAEHARAYLTACWQALRPQLMGREAVVPRIWRT
jgi:urease accessory protein